MLVKSDLKRAGTPPWLRNTHDATLGMREPGKLKSVSVYSNMFHKAPSPLSATYFQHVRLRSPRTLFDLKMSKDPPITALVWSI